MNNTTIFSDAQLIDYREKIIDSLLRGGIVVYPTSTLYGIGCDARNPEAIRKINRLKDREEERSMIVLCPEEQVNEYMENPAEKRFFMENYWPGPLTLIVKQSGRLPDIVSNDKGAVALRVSNNFVVRSIVKEGIPLISTSANISEEETILKKEKLISCFEGKVDYIIYNKNMTSRLPSTMIDLTSFPPSARIVREGVISDQELVENLPDVKWE